MEASLVGAVLSQRYKLTKLIGSGRLFETRW